MTLVRDRVVSLPSSGLVKMDDRKRPAAHDHEDSAPPSKKQATSVNGAGKAHIDAEMPWKDDLESFQKEAIWRQMQEYKRERNTLELQMNSLAESARYHDDHLRAIDAWFAQLLDEIKIMLGNAPTHGNFVAFPSALLTTDSETLQKHLQSRSSEIASAISQLFARSTAPSPEIADLQGQIASLLASEKGHITAIEKSRLEQEQLLQRLEAASTRYILAERKLDRAKSVTVAKLERQATFSGRTEGGSGLGGGMESSVDDQKEPGKGKAENGNGHFEAERGRKEAVAALAKQTEQLRVLETENEKLTSQVTALNSRLSHLTDDDYSQTDLFKQLRSQHEDVIKRINHLEATNIQLRQEAEKLQKERTAYRIQLETETQTAVAEKEAQLAQAEHDLARIRAARDELLADVAIRKATQNQERASTNQIKELAIAREERVKALESEVERLLVLSKQQTSNPSPDPNVGNISPTDLPNKYISLERQHSMLKNELESMNTAYKKVTALASQKVENFSTLEEKITRLSAEKSKADQKYFATMKAKEAREQEVRSLRASSSKSSEMVSTLKDAEAASRAALVNHEKELAEFKASYASISNQYRICQQQLTEEKIAVEALKAQAEELKSFLLSKDSSASAVASAHRKAEVEIETLNVRVEEMQRSLESWKRKGLGHQSEEYEMLRTLTICTVCRLNFKNTAIKTCGHVFCRECVEERQASRSRKCPNCNKAFGANDNLHITL